MHTRTVLSAAVLTAVGTAAAVPAGLLVEGPPAGFTGGFGEPTCVTCHLGNEVDAFDGRVHVLGLPDAYERGAEYALTVVLEAEGTDVAGFQMTARRAEGDRRGQDAGRLLSVDARTAVRDSIGVSYLHHTREGTTTSSSDGSSWSVLWIAPTSGGPATINVAANSGNDDNSPLNDLVYAAEVTVAQGQTAPEPDSAKLLRDLSVLAHDSMEGRAPGTPGSLRARTFLLGALAESGAEPVGDKYEYPFQWDRGSGVNLVGTIPGPMDEVIVLTAHYDHVGIRNGDTYNGTDDNASGVAAVLEVARRVVESPLRHTLVVALLDAEESGLRGARAFVAAPPIPADRIVLDVNLDMVSRTGGLLWAGGSHHTPALRPVLEQVAESSPVTLRLGHDRPAAPEGDDWTNSSDHGPFHAAGIPFVYFGVEDHPDYHRPTDDFGRVDAGEYVDAVRTILSALYALDRSLPLTENENPR